MKLSALVAFASLAALAGCASRPAPEPVTPASTVVTDSPAWAKALPPEGDIEFTTVAAPKAKAARADDAPATQLKMDSASGQDVKTTHLRAAERKEPLPE